MQYQEGSDMGFFWNYMLLSVCHLVRVYERWSEITPCPRPFSVEGYVNCETKHVDSMHEMKIVLWVFRIKRTSLLLLYCVKWTKKSSPNLIFGLYATIFLNIIISGMYDNEKMEFLKIHLFLHKENNLINFCLNCLTMGGLCGGKWRLAPKKVA